MHRIDLKPSSPVLFYDFFPEFGRVVGKLFTDSCQDKIQAYHNSTNVTSLNRAGYAAIECLFKIDDPVIQINYAGASVLLGLLPTILSMLGSHTMETALLSTRRPFLSFLLALGAPVLAPAGLFVSTNPKEFLELGKMKSKKSVPPTNSGLRLMILAIEYMLALVAIANVTLIALQLAMMAVSISIAPVSVRFHWLLWTYIAPTIHFFGLVAFLCRFDHEMGKTRRLKRFFGRIWGGLKAEFRICGQPPERQSAKWDTNLPPENICSFVLSAWVSFLIVAHIVYGTTLFSATQLVFGLDALLIIARYLASAVVCRAVLVFELYRLSNTHVLDVLQDAGEDSGEYNLEAMHRSL